MIYRAPKPLLSERLEQWFPAVFVVGLSGMSIYGAITQQRPEQLFLLVIMLAPLLLKKYANYLMFLALVAYLAVFVVWPVYRKHHGFAVEHVNEYWFIGVSLLCFIIPHKWFPQALLGYMAIVIGMEIWAEKVSPENWLEFMIENWAKSLIAFVSLAMLVVLVAKPKKGITPSDI
jgi:hypothetical protein